MSWEPTETLSTIWQISPPFDGLERLGEITITSSTTILLAREKRTYPDGTYRPRSRRLRMYGGLDAEQVRRMAFIDALDNDPSWGNDALTDSPAPCTGADSYLNFLDSWRPGDNFSFDIVRPPRGAVDGLTRYAAPILFPTCIPTRRLNASMQVDTVVSYAGTRPNTARYGDAATRWRVEYKDPSVVQAPDGQWVMFLVRCMATEPGPDDPPPNWTPGQALYDIVAFSSSTPDFGADTRGPYLLVSGLAAVPQPGASAFDRDRGPANFRCYVSVPTGVFYDGSLYVYYVVEPNTDGGPPYLDLDDDYVIRAGAYRDAYGEDTFRSGVGLAVVPNVGSLFSTAPALDEAAWPWRDALATDLRGLVRSWVPRGWLKDSTEAAYDAAAARVAEAEAEVDRLTTCRGRIAELLTELRDGNLELVIELWWTGVAEIEGCEGAFVISGILSRLISTLPGILVWPVLLVVLLEDIREQLALLLATIDALLAAARAEEQAARGAFTRLDEGTPLLERFYDAMGGDKEAERGRPVDPAAVLCPGGPVLFYRVWEYPDAATDAAGVWASVVLLAPAFNEETGAGYTEHTLPLGTDVLVRLDPDPKRDDLPADCVARAYEEGGSLISYLDPDPCRIKPGTWRVTMGVMKGNDFLATVYVDGTEADVCREWEDMIPPDVFYLSDAGTSVAAAAPSDLWSAGPNVTDLWRARREKDLWSDAGNLPTLWG